MQGRRFLDLAREVLAGATELHWRGSMVHSYYGLFLECRDTLRRWGFPPPRLQSVHSFVRLRLVLATDADLKRIGQVLEILGQDRNRASYELSPSPKFASAAAAQRDRIDAGNALALLDQIDADPARRTAAIAALPP